MSQADLSRRQRLWGQADELLLAVKKSLNAADLYSDQQVANILKALEAASVKIKGQLLGMAELGDLDAGKVLWKKRLEGVLKRIEGVTRELKGELKLLTKPMVKGAFRGGVGSAIAEFQEIGVKGYALLFPETKAEVVAAAMSLEGRSALDFMLRFNLKLVGQVPDLLLADIKMAVNVGIISGGGIAKIAQDLGEVALDAGKFSAAGKRVFKRAGGRLTTIVRTEVMRAHNQGRLKFYKVAGLKEVQWYTADDQRVCPTCDPLNGQDFSLDKLPPQPLHPQCRCTHVASEKSLSQVRGPDDLLRRADRKKSRAKLKVKS